MSFIRLCILLVALLTASCVGKLAEPPPEVDYYALEYELPGFAGYQPLPVVLRVGDFAAAPIYDTDRMVFQKASYTADSYPYHRWEARPARLVKTHLVRDLRESGLFKAVITERGVPRTPVLEGMVNEFLEWDGQEHWEARLSLTITLLASNGGTKSVVLQKTYEKRQPSAEELPRGVAEAMSRALAEISNQITTDIYQALAPQPAGGSNPE